MPLSKISRAKVRIMIFGTFDRVHPGHVFLFKQALKVAKNPYLIVSIARDKNVFSIKHRFPDLTELERKAAVEATGLPHKVVLGGVRNHIPHIIREHPSIIALGYDQVAYTKGLRRALSDHGLRVRVVRIPSFRPDKYKSSKLRKHIKGVIQS